MNDNVSRLPATAGEKADASDQPTGKGKSTEQAQGKPAGAGSTKKETRWEVGIFLRSVTTESTTPPEYPNKPDQG